MWDLLFKVATRDWNGWIYVHAILKCKKKKNPGQPKFVIIGNDNTIKDETISETIYLLPNNPGRVSQFFSKFTYGYKRIEH